MELKRQSSDSRKLLRNRARNYHDQLKASDRGKEYLQKERGLAEETIRKFALGICEVPEEDDHIHQGRIAIPYMTVDAVGNKKNFATIRYRGINGEQTKYLGYAGAGQRLFNPAALYDREHDYICICEGEFDAIAATQAGLPAVGIAGANVWQPFYKRLFYGYKRIFVLADDDQPGMEVAKKIAKELSNVAIIRTEGDVNSMLVDKGEQAIRELIGEK